MEKYGYNYFLITNKPQENEKTKPRKEKAKLKQNAKWCKKSFAHEHVSNLYISVSNDHCHFVIQNTPNMTKMERITEKYLISYRTFMNSLVEDEREGEKHL